MLNQRNGPHIEQFLHDLAEQGCSGCNLLFARIVPPEIDPVSALLNTQTTHYSVKQFAELEVHWMALAKQLGFNVDDGFGHEEALPCSAIKPSQFVVEPRGQVKRCFMGVSDDAETVGSIRSGQFEASVRDSDWMQYDPFSDPGCEACSFLPICYGGCPKLKI